MATEKYTIKATLDDAELSRGAASIIATMGKVEQAVDSATPSAGTDRATKAMRELTTATKAQQSAERGKVSFQQRASMSLGVATAGVGVVGSALTAGGYGDLGDGLMKAASGARQLGTMLAPLGPQAAIIGAAAGGIAGAVSALADNFVAENKRIKAAAEEAAKIAKEADVAERVRRASEKITLKEWNALAKTDPDAARGVLKTIKKDLSEAMVFAKEGAPIKQDLARAALFFPKETGAVLREGYKNNPGSLTREQKDLGMAINSGNINEQQNRAASGGNWAQWNRLNDLTNRLWSQSPELMSRGFRERSTGVESSRVDDAVRNGFAADPTQGFKARASSADSLQSAGMGIVSNPTLNLENLTREGNQILERIERKIGPAALAG